MRLHTGLFHIRRLGWLTLAWSCVGLGAAGTILPLLPTTPFVLVAAWAAPKGSPRLALWLDTHPRLGPVLHAWHDHRAVPRRAKWAAAVTLVFSWALLWWLNTATGVLIFLAFLFIAVAAFVISRPNADTTTP